MITQTASYDLGINEVLLGEEDGQDFICIPSGLYMLSMDFGMERISDEELGQLLRGSITRDTQCSNCQMPLNSTYQEEFGDVYFCGYCDSPDLWVPLTFINLHTLIVRALATRNDSLRELLVHIQREKL